MKSNMFREFLLRLLSVALISMGFMQVSSAGMIGTGYLIESDAREASLQRLEVLLAKQDVADQLQAFGVEPAMIAERLAGMTNAELLQIEGTLNSQTVGGDALGVIGAVFLVLLILELVGVTDIFKAM